MRGAWMGCVVVALACASWPAHSGAVAEFGTTEGTCTAWAVGQEQWLTAYHCTIHGDGWIRGTEARRLAGDEAVDVALVTGPVSRTMRVASRAPAVGAKLTAYGYGLGRGVLLMLDGRLAADHSSFFGTTRDDLVYTQANGMPGMSGGPILSGGRVVSMVTGGGLPATFANQVGRGVPWSDLAKFVARHVR